MAKEQLPKPQEGSGGPRLQLVVFAVGAEHYALPIDQIKEVVVTPNVARIPQTPDYVKGVANIRGNVLAIVDLEKKFGVTPPTDVLPRYTLVLESAELHVGLMVRNVPNTLSVAQSDIDPSPNLIGEGEEQPIAGIVKHANRMIILIDAPRLLRGGVVPTLAAAAVA